MTSKGAESAVKPGGQEGCEALMNALRYRDPDALCARCPNKKYVVETIAGQASSVMLARQIVRALDSHVPGNCTGRHILALSVASGERAKTTSGQDGTKQVRLGSPKKEGPKNEQARRKMLAEYKREWRLANRDRFLRYRRNYRVDNRLRIGEYDRGYRLANRARINARRRAARNEAAVTKRPRKAQPPT